MNLSLNQPLNTLSSDAVLSATPEINPIMTVLAPSTFARKSGMRVKINSLEMSVRKLTHPRKKTFGLRPRIDLFEEFCIVTLTLPSP